MTVDEALQIDLAEAMNRASELNVSAEPLSYDERCVLLLRDEVRRLREQSAADNARYCANLDEVYAEYRRHRDALQDKLARVEALKAWARRNLQIESAYLVEQKIADALKDES